MIKSRLKKITLLVLRPDLDKVFTDLIDLGCIHFCPQEELLEDTALCALADLETVDLEQHNANQGILAAFGTDRTLLFSGWIPAKSEAEVLARLSNYTCAYEIRQPTPDDGENAPVKLRFPKFFKVFYRNTAKPFSPLEG